MDARHGDLAAKVGGSGRHEGDSGRLGLGVSGLYLALYIHYGFFAFLPLWLKATGASPEEIGILLAIPLVLRLLTVAPFSAFVGRRGWVRNAIAYTSLASAAIVLLLLGEPDHAGRIVIVILFSIVWDQIPVLTDAYAVMAVRSRSLDFGRLRVWGSIAVVASNAAAGWAIGIAGIKMLPLMIAVLLIAPAMVAFLLPTDRKLSAVDDAAGGRWRDLIGDRGLILAMVAASLIMGSHGVLTSFGAIQWESQGISTTTIGLLQALAVAAEIGAFWFGAKLLGNRDPRLLIVAGAIAGALRWAIMAASPGLPLLVFGQLLNGITATGTILGIMLVIAQRVPTHLSATAQGMNAVLLGLVLAVATAGSGLLWSYGLAVAYLAMSVLALLGALCAWPRGAGFGKHDSTDMLSTSGAEG
ncbi:MFS transporter, PPP family, 3-phenylpropionic acid transporter [Sphingopyxis sp. YR583]|uniref:MFS transporter n=1 Tax=Sphingopyxis sp. YR583 TaxID=1881047 RepID=UPI0008A7D64B|nr:MFS transporter [Sphingopyxis sp. YR583]SEH19670.1 MFS transporter, PPP family, 3-phenylpropionic acid transporter [Sphingopyxis sp. YR583]